MADSTAEEIKKSLVRDYNFIDESDVRVTTDIASYSPGTNRNAGPGEVCTWVFVSAPESPDDRDYRHTNTRVVKDDNELDVEDIQRMIMNACKTVSSRYEDAEFIGRAKEHEGYDSSHSGEFYYNIRINN